MKLLALLGALALACAAAAAADLSNRAPRYAPGGMVIEKLADVQAAKRGNRFVVMPAGSVWESADTMWLSLGDVWIHPRASFGFHEAQSCPPGVPYGGWRCVRNEFGTALMRANVPECVRRLGDHWRVWDKPALSYFNGAAILGMCADDPTIKRLA